MGGWPSVEAALLEFKKAIAVKVDYIIVRVTRDNPV